MSELEDLELDDLIDRIDPDLRRALLKKLLEERLLRRKVHVVNVSPEPASSRVRDKPMTFKPKVRFSDLYNDTYKIKSGIHYRHGPIITLKFVKENTMLLGPTEVSQLITGLESVLAFALERHEGAEETGDTDE